MRIESFDIFNKSDQIAWTGSGGKSSLIFSICKSVFPKSIVTTTTHLAKDQSNLASRHHNCDNPMDPFLNGTILDGTTLITKETEISQWDRLQGFYPSELIELSSFCHQNEVPLFIEADGSRQKPLKAPKENEPQIPDFVNKVCVVVGLNGLGKPLDENWVHRVQNFSAIIEKSRNETISLDDIYRYITNFNGGIKSIPAHAQKILFLNQFDMIEEKESIYLLAEKCRPFYDHIFISSVNQITNEIEIFAHFGKIACILLAAGESSRFGSPKQLANWNGKTFIRTIIEKIVLTNPSEFLVIIGAFHELIINEINDFSNVKIIKNPNWSSGQASSVNIGVENLSVETEAVIFLLVDQPQIEVKNVRDLIIAFAKTNENIIAYNFQGKARHPVLFSKKLFNALCNLSGNSGGKQLFSKNPPLFLIFEDPKQARDFDTPEDLKNYWES